MTELEQLREEIAFYREQYTAFQWARMQERFHAFDSIKDDACPACGGRVSVEDNGYGSGVKLRAVR